jgi:peptide/nickel transport system permease protein
MTNILKLIGFRLVSGTFILIIVSIVIFGAIELAPGDPATRVLGKETPEEELAVWRTTFGLDRPMTERYFRWLGGVVTGDLGPMMRISQQPISEVLPGRIKNSLWLAGAAVLIYIPITLSISILSAVYRYRYPDHALSFFTLLMLSMPVFVVAPGILVLFVLTLDLLPAVQFIERADSVGDYAKILILPASVLAIGMSGHAIRMLRDNLIEVLDSDYVQMAHFKGLPLHRVILSHALPNSLMPVLSVTALNISFLLGGSLIVELVFSYPGLGRLLFDAIALSDGPLIEITVLIGASLFIAANTVTDILALLLVPRLRTG